MKVNKRGEDVKLTDHMTDAAAFTTFFITCLSLSQMRCWNELETVLIVPLGLKH
jgi:hypothetical protein